MDCAVARRNLGHVESRQDGEGGVIASIVRPLALGGGGPDAFCIQS